LTLQETRLTQSTTTRNHQNCVCGNFYKRDASGGHRMRTAHNADICHLESSQYAFGCHRSTCDANLSSTVLQRLPVMGTSRSCNCLFIPQRMRVLSLSLISPVFQSSQLPCILGRYCCWCTLLELSKGCS
jgi:hypothetical protein